jgi:DNA-binding NarL/FixJ family response regulator
MGAPVNACGKRHAFHPVHLQRRTGRADLPLAEAIAVDHLTRPEAGGVRTAIRVLIAAGSALVVAAYRALLEGDDRIEVVGEATDSREVVVRAEDTRPDVALLDLTARCQDPTAIAAIVSHPALARVAVILIGPDEEERVLSALRAGAVGVLANAAEPAELIRAIRLLAAGNALLPARSMHRLIDELPPPSQNRPVPERFEELTNREREVVALAAAGMTNGEIAERLVISPRTAKTHVGRAMTKLQARDRTQLVVFAHEAGLIRIWVDRRGWGS